MIGNAATQLHLKMLSWFSKIHIIEHPFSGFRHPIITQELVKIADSCTHMPKWSVVRLKDFKVSNVILMQVDWESRFEKGYSRTKLNLMGLETYPSRYYWWPPLNIVKLQLSLDETSYIKQQKCSKTQQKMMVIRMPLEVIKIVHFVHEAV